MKDIENKFDTAVKSSVHDNLSNGLTDNHSVFLTGRRRARTATARRQTDRLAGRTYVNAAARATNPTTGPSMTNQPAVTTTTNPINDTRAARADRRSRRARARQALTSDATSAVNDTTAASNDARNDRARRRSSRRR